MKKVLLMALGLATVTAHASTPKEKPFVPLLTEDFPDPHILRHGDQFLAYATNATGDRANVQMATSCTMSCQCGRHGCGRG